MTKGHLKKLTFSSLQDIAEQFDEEQVRSYVSHHLAVARISSNELTRHFLSQPFMMDEVRVLVLQKGHVDVRINMIGHRLEAGTLIFIGRYVVTEIIHVTDDIRGFVFSMSDEMLRLSAGKGAPNAFNGHLQDFILPLSSVEMDFLDHLHLLLYSALKQDMSSSPVVIQLVGALVMHISYLWEKGRSLQTGARTREQQLFSAFIRLVSQYAPKQHNLDFYASHLCVTPRYMSTVVRHVSGKSAKYWIDEAIVNAIKVQLRYTDKQAAEIAYDMNFPNPSFFCKYFKRMTGMTPLDFREHIQ